MPPERQSHPRWRLRGTKGRIEERNGKCRLRYGDYSIGLDLPFEPEYKEQALAILKKYHAREVRRRLARELGIDIETVSTTVAPTVRAVLTTIDHYYTERFPQMTPSGKKLADLAFAHFFADDCPLDYTAISTRISERAIGSRISTTAKPGTPIGPQTLRNYLGALARFLTWCERRKWIDGNPAKHYTLRQPPPPGGEPYTDAELRSIIEHIADREVRLLVEFIALSGARIGEATKLLRKDVTGRFLTLSSKGKTRHLPIDAIPGLRDVISRALSLKAHRVRLWRWADGQSPRVLFNAAVAAAHVRKRAQPLHALRDTAIHTWEYVLGWDRTTSADAAGHTLAVHEMSYHKGPSGEDLERRIKRHSPVR